MSVETREFLTTLFRPGELVCHAPDTYWTGAEPLEQVLEQEPLEFIGVNPLVQGPRSTDNVASLRNFIFEFDSIPLEEQLAVLQSRGVPYSTLTFSGGKSLHAVIALDEPVKDVAAYKLLHKTIRYVLWQTDASTSNPDRLIRLAGARRFDKDAEQELLDCRGQVTQEQLYKWVRKFQKHIVACEEREQQRLAERLERRSQSSDDGLGIEAVSPYYRAFLSGDVELKPGQSRHHTLLCAAYDYFTCGVDFDRCLQDVSAAADLWGVTSQAGREGEALKVVEYVYLGK